MLAVAISCRRNGPIESMTSASAGSEARRCAMAIAGAKPYSPALSSAIYPHAFDREHTEFCRDAAYGGETTRFASGSQHAMAGHDNRERVSSKGLSDGAGRAARVQPRRNLAVGQRLAGRDAAGNLEHAA